MTKIITSSISFIQEKLAVAMDWGSRVPHKQWTTLAEGFGAGASFIEL